MLGSHQNVFTPPSFGEETFQRMLELDKGVFENIAQSKALIKSAKQRIIAYDNGETTKFASKNQRDNFASALNRNIKRNNQIIQSYETRQKDYRENPIYNLSKNITDWSGETVDFLSDIWNDFTSIFGAFPLLVPAAWIVGVVATVAVISYFVSTYYQDANIDYNNSLKLIAGLSDSNPRLAKSLLKNLNKAKAAEQKAGFSTQIGRGIKAGIIVTGVTTASIGGFFLAKRLKLIKT